MEIVAPAGDYNRFLACIKGGADSIYLGLKGVGARRKAPNFTLEELKEAIDFAHLKGVKIYLTLNTIFKDVEIEALYTNIKQIYEWGVDAFIVQDIGMLKFLKDNFPKVELHGSTQMTVSNHVEAQFYKDLGLTRIVLSRELSFEDIKSIKEKCDIDLEIFVSGALCVSYSGNCYLSSFIGSRSGNRGLCAQPCRKIYRSETKDSYFLSPKDQLMGQKEIEMLSSIGVESIKVEGRMKSEEYVYETVNYYKDLLNGFYRNNESFKLFNRGYSTGYFYGENKNLMNNNFSFDLGYLLGILKGRELELNDKIMLGDGIVYLDKDYNKIGGEYISKIITDKNENLRTAEKSQKIYLNKVPEGAYYIHKTYDKELYDKLNKELKEGKRRVPVDIKFDIKKAEKVRLSLTYKNIQVEVLGQELELAKNPLSVDKVKEKVEELGETPFIARNTQINYDGEAFLSFAYLKELKREAANLLEEKIIESFRRIAKEEIVLEKSYDSNRKKPKIFVSVLNENQYNFVRSLGITDVYYKNPDVAKESNLEKIDKNNRLCGNLYQLLTSNEKELWLDWNNNIINSYAMSVLKNVPKLQGVFISPEIKREDIQKIDSFGLEKGIVVYGKMRVMYIEKDLIKEKEEIINEQTDKLVLVKNQFGNTEVYLNEELNLIPKLDEIENLGLDYIKLEFTFEDNDKIKEILDSIEKRSGQYKAYNFESGLY